MKKKLFTLLTLLLCLCSGAWGQNPTFKSDYNDFTSITGSTAKYMWIPKSVIDEVSWIAPNSASSGNKKQSDFIDPSTGVTGTGTTSEAYYRPKDHASKKHLTFYLTNITEVSFYAYNSNSSKTLKAIVNGGEEQTLATTDDNNKSIVGTISGLNASTNYTIEIYNQEASSGAAEMYVGAIKVTPGSLTCSTPKITPTSFTTDNQKVTITCGTAGATIYYTTNGTDPTTGSAVYDANNKPTISSTTTFKAYAVKANYNDSEIAESTIKRIVGGSYTFNYKDEKTIDQLKTAGWEFHEATANPTSTGTYVNLVSAFNTSTAETITALNGNGVKVFDDNAVAFAKNSGVYAMYDLGESKTVRNVSGVFYVGSSKARTFTIEYIDADKETVKSTITINHPANKNWVADNVNDPRVVDEVRYIKIKGMTSDQSWIVMEEFSVLYGSESLPISTHTASGADRTYASYVTTQKLDFSAAEGITAYIAKNLNSTSDAVIIQPVVIVPANTPIIVKTSTPGATVNVPITTADASDVSGNNLVAGDGTTTWDGTPGYTYYYLAGDEFHKGTSGTLQAGKAYLKLAGDPTSAKAMTLFIGEGETTAINGIEEVAPVTKTRKVVKNGRLVIETANGEFTIDGARVK